MFVMCSHILHPVMELAAASSFAVLPSVNTCMPARPAYCLCRAHAAVQQAATVSCIGVPTTLSSLLLTDANTTAALVVDSAAACTALVVIMLRGARGTAEQHISVCSAEGPLRRGRQGLWGQAALPEAVWEAGSCRVVVQNACLLCTVHNDCTQHK